MTQEGGREGAETSFECVAREVWKELGLTLIPEQIIWGKVYPSVLEAGKKSVFLVGSISQKELDSFHFSDEGQGWKMMQMVEFLSHRKVIPRLQKRVEEYLDNRNRLFVNCSGWRKAIITY